MERERDLVEALRAELAAIEPVRACCRRAELAGLGDAARGRARSPAVARLAVRLGSPGTDGAAFDWASAAEHCRVSWVRGRFLSAGSLSLTASRTHLEFVVPVEEAEALAVRLSQLGMPASHRVRRGRGVVIWKSREVVLTFLRRAGASAAVLESESRAVTRALHGQLNRALNAETANVRRSVAASARQLAAIEALASTGELERLPAFDRSVAGLRQSEPGQTFSELAEQLGVSRARVQRALVRIEDLAARTAATSVSR